MALQIGEKLGTYEILQAIGEGGMGAVYRAKDSKLKREVAIKALPDAFSRDGIAVARFQREAEALASLNHASIGAIYDVVESQGSRFLVLELIEGETLAERIARGPIPIDEALPIARQIAEALEAAHEKGVTHRDLKPANIKLTPAGLAKVLDFGLAKTRSVETDVSLSNTPTLATSMPGTILGTPAYMSPEQAKGRETDRTTDVWSFGCVLYEMLTGRPVFEGETLSEILADVLKAEPDWGRLPAETPEAIRRLLRRCLRKDPRTRLRDIGDARLEIDDAQTAAETGSPAAVAPPASRLKERLAWAALLLVALVAGGLAGRSVNRTVTPPEMRVEVAALPTFQPAEVAISPDRQMIAYVAEADGRAQLWLRRLDSAVAKPLPGGSNAAYLFWSPNNRSLGFIADGKLKTIDTESGSVRVLANAPNARGGTWNAKDVILFTPFNPGIVYRIPASGGKPEPATQLEEGQQQGNHLFAQFLPDGQHFLYFDSAPPPKRGIYVQSLDGGKATRLVDSDSAGAYSAGYLFFVQQGKFVAQAFDPDRLALSGMPSPVADDIPNLAQRPVPVSAAGAIVYRPNNPPPAKPVPFYWAWLDRTGKEVGAIPEMLSGAHWAMSRDNRNFAQERTTEGNIDIWRYDFGRGIRNRVTTDPVTDTFPVLSPASDRVVFTSNRKSTTYDLYVALTDKPGSDELLLSSQENKIATDWSSDGRYILYRNFSDKNGYDVLALPVDANGRKNGDPIVVVSTPADERDAQFSPDGKWVAYQSNETGAFEIYVQPFLSSTAPYQVSKGGGTQPRWNPNGKELFYIALDGQFTSVPIKFDPSGQRFEAGVPVTLFLSTLRGNEIQTPNRQQYAVSPDGQRFLMRNLPITPNTMPLRLILNWRPK